MRSCHSYTAPRFPLLDRMVDSLIHSVARAANPELHLACSQLANDPALVIHHSRKLSFSGGRETFFRDGGIGLLVFSSSPLSPFSRVVERARYIGRDFSHFQRDETNRSAASHFSIPRNFYFLLRFSVFAVSFFFFSTVSRATRHRWNFLIDFKFSFSPISCTSFFLSFSSFFRCNF